jgi:epoxyqueuosine reductase
VSQPPEPTENAPFGGLPGGVTRHEPAQQLGAAMADPAELAERVRRAAAGLGFAQVGFCSVERLTADGAALERWLAAERHAQMRYLAAAERASPTQLLPQAKTAIVVALPYPAAPIVELRLGRDAPARGIIARYARGADYHGVIKDKLRRLADACATLAGRPVLARACVDTAPLLERGLAARAGVGFAAKNTMTIVPGVGSFVLLGELLVDLDIPYDAAIAPRCGSCRACLDACPTGAFVEERVLDARRCISYWTIEHRGIIPLELRPLLGLHVFGCDICQEVCPFNASAAPRSAAPELAPRSELEPLDLVALLELTSAGYRRLVRGSALRRASRPMLSRNAAVCLGNTADPRAVGPLARALLTHRFPLVRGHAAWALGRLGGEAARAALERARDDVDPWVRDEARLAVT